MCTHGDAEEYPVATVKIRVQERKVTIEAAVSDKLPHSVLLGTDVPELVSWLKKENKALMVVTRSHSRRQPNSEVALKDSGTAAISNGGGVAVESVTTESRAEAEGQDVNSGSTLNDVCEVSPVPLSEETVSMEVNVLSRE